MDRKVVITGIGVVSPYGLGHECFWEAIKSGQTAIKKWSIKGVDNFPVKYAATVDVELLRESYPESFPKRASIERRAIFGLAAAEMAMKDAAITADQLGRIGVSVCSGVPDSDDHTLSQLAGFDPSEALARLQKNRNELVNYYSGIRCSNDVLATEIAKKYGATGPVLNINGACAGATQAIGIAYKSIRRGEADAMLVGGGDSVLNIRTLSALFTLGATSTTERFGDKLCRPFDQGRSGLVAGEGAAILLIEDEESAIKRGATIYSELLGYGTSLDAYKATAPHPDGLGAISAMKNALRDANLRPKDIDYINAHGTSTPLNDVVETKAIKEVFGSHCKDTMVVSSTKSMIGHWIAAAGAPEAVATVLAIKHQCVPPTVNLARPDEGCDLDYVPGKYRDMSVKNCLSNSFGFGGLNATLVLGKY